MAASLQLHAEHNSLNEVPTHYARTAALRAREQIGDQATEVSLRSHRAANKAKHDWSDETRRPKKRWSDGDGLEENLALTEETKEEKKETHDECLPGALLVKAKVSTQEIGVQTIGDASFFENWGFAGKKKKKKEVVKEGEATEPNQQEFMAENDKSEDQEASAEKQEVNTTPGSAANTKAQVISLEALLDLGKAPGDDFNEKLMEDRIVRIEQALNRFIDRDAVFGDHAFSRAAGAPPRQPTAEVASVVGCSRSASSASAGDGLVAEPRCVLNFVHSAAGVEKSEEQEKEQEKTGNSTAQEYFAEARARDLATEVTDRVYELLEDKLEHILCIVQPVGSLVLRVEAMGKRLAVLEGSVEACVAASEAHEARETEDMNDAPEGYSLTTHHEARPANTSTRQAVRERNCCGSRCLGPWRLAYGPCSSCRSAAMAAHSLSDRGEDDSESDFERDYDDDFYRGLAAECAPWHAPEEDAGEFVGRVGNGFPCGPGAHAHSGSSPRAMQAHVHDAALGPMSPGDNSDSPIASLFGRTSEDLEPRDHVSGCG